MPQLERTLNLPYTPEQLYKLVDDIEQYPQFLPYCTEAKVLKREGETVEGSVRVGYKNIGYTFCTRNHHVPFERIHMSLAEGPLKELEGEWMFSGTEHGCQVQLRLRISFKNKLMDIAFQKKMHDVTDKMVNAFVDRAKAVYGH